MRDEPDKETVFEKFTEKFKDFTKSMSPAETFMTAYRLIGKRLVYDNLALRRQMVAEFLQTVRTIKNYSLDLSAFHNGLHTKSSEPYFAEMAYKVSAASEVTVIDRDNRCLATKNNSSIEDTSEVNLASITIAVDTNGTCHLNRDTMDQSASWKCSIMCKKFTDEQKKIIINLKNSFDNSVEMIRLLLEHVDDGCEQAHYCKSCHVESSDEGCHFTVKELMGHPIHCAFGSCDSQLHLLRAAAVHHPALRTFLNYVYHAKRSSAIINKIESDLSCLHSIKSLMENIKLANIAVLLDYDEIPSSTTHKSTALSTIESHLEVEFAKVINEYTDKLKQDAEYCCCSCERLLLKKNLTHFNFTAEKFDSDTWIKLKTYLLKKDPDVSKKTLYVCTYCRPILNANNIPGRCVLNGLFTEACPEELLNLNTLESQFIQRAKCFQTIVRLGTYTGKVPVYNSLKAIKGTIFFLPLPLQNTLDRLDEVGFQCDKSIVGLPDPELYIIVDSRPTKNKVVWQGLVDIDHVKGAVDKLRDINWLYNDVHQASVDEVAKKAIEIVNVADSPMLEKASEEDIAGLQAYTIRKMDQYMPTGKDIDHYKLLSVKETPIDNRQKYLDVLCFPTLFPTGQYGEFHPRAVKLTFSEYVKSRILNCDSRFRKSPEFIFYYLWQKELRELSAGIYNVLNSGGRKHICVKDFVQGINESDPSIEANLATVLQSVRGTKQFWFLKKSDVMAMVREYGSPTFFLTFSCAEYESPDIDTYLRKVNKVSDKYPTSKLCIEDPVSVSRKFSQKFRDFFTTVLLKGEVLGKVTHYFWKKEYQARGAPHYHVLLWIDDAPVIGKHSPKDVLNWIQSKITCHIPDEKASPELHRLVTKYQLHRCSNYCKRTKKYGSAYITRCKFNFPREVANEASLNSVEESLKSRNKIYVLPRAEGEERVNDYNPLLLLLWKANIDVQFVSESTLALAQYVSGYVTKAEKSHMQEVWQEISEQESLYKKLWSFGVRSLRSRECGLYEAADILLGDHLSEKSDTVQWIYVEKPEKRKVRVKKYQELQQLAESNPDSNDLYQANLVDNFYPTRPAALKDVCLYDFVKWYRKADCDRDGKRQYVRLEKPRIPNHRIYDPNKPEEREAYFYSLLLLFMPFTEESELLSEGQSAEDAFNDFFSKCASMEEHHESLQRMLQAQSKVKTINEARKGEDVPLKEEAATEEEGIVLIGEAEAAMHDVQDIECDTINLHERISMLNEDQHRIFKKVTDHLTHQYQHEQNSCKCHNLKPLHMFISGVGGTGKSFLIETIRTQVKEIWKEDVGNDTTCAVAAPTGLAAYNVGGITVHRLFQLPIEHEGKTAGYWALSKVAQKVMRTNLRSLKLIIIDEVSMLSSLNLAYIHLRLEELFGGSGDWFGSVNMLFVGDILQLPPVNGSPVFSKLTNKLIATRMGCMTSVNIWKESVIYDELTINERQKKDRCFVDILDEVRRGSVSQPTLEHLKQRVINGTIVDKYKELCGSGHSPVCLFPTRKACHEFNMQMLSHLDSKKHKILCVDEIDETSSSLKWSKKAQKELDKVNKDSNLTAGLEAELTIAVGARVMLRRNIDTKQGLVNGAIGTVTSVSSQTLMVKFDHIDSPCPIEMVRSKFILMKSFFVYRKQFPLTVAYAVTIHKCQGLSLDCAIVDLSSNVFCAGMAYVAISRVRTLEGLHLTAFDPKSISVSNCCLEEVNRLRRSFRKDLPLYEISVENKAPVKRQLLHTCDQEAPVKKKPKLNATLNHMKQCGEMIRSATDRPTKKHKFTKSNKDCEVVAVDRPVMPRYEWSDYRYYPVNEEWQRRACDLLGIQFLHPFCRQDGGPHVVLTRPDLRSLKSIGADGNCMFRALSYIVSGSENQHLEVRNAIVAHMRTIPHLVSGIGPDGNRNYLVTYDDGYSSVEDYLSRSHIADNGVWGGDFEMCIVAHLLDTPVYSFQGGDGDYWLACFPHSIDRSIPENVNVQSMYIFLRSSHFQVVTGVRKRLTS